MLERLQFILSGCNAKVRYITTESNCLLLVSTLVVLLLLFETKLYHFSHTSVIVSVVRLLQGFQGEKGEPGDRGSPGLDGLIGSPGMPGPPVCQLIHIFLNILTLRLQVGARSLSSLSLQAYCDFLKFGLYLLIHCLFVL